MAPFDTDRPVEPEYDEDRRNCHDAALLRQELLELSRSTVWDEAKLEWDLQDAYWEDGFTHCLCGHGIKERCILFNKHTKCRALVGNCCVKRFAPDLAKSNSTDAAFASIRRVKKSYEKALHSQLVRRAHQLRRISAWAEAWYLRNRRSRTLTPKELAYRRRLNARILAAEEEEEEDRARATDEEKRFCMPHGGPWALDEHLLQEALDAGRLTEWEVSFYKTKYGLSHVSAPQSPIKRRIEESTLQNPWPLECAQLTAARVQGLITQLDQNYYEFKASKKLISSWDAQRKWRIEELVLRATVPPHASERH